ncbi:MAG: hypothetical protein ABEJ91_04055 [Candidatus Nanohaloarchaea archaeon]
MKGITTGEVDRLQLLVAGFAVFVLALSGFYIHSVQAYSMDVEVEAVNYTENLTLGRVDRVTLRVTNNMDRSFSPIFGYVQTAPTTYFFRRVAGEKTLEPGEQDLYVVEAKGIRGNPGFRREIVLVILDNGTQYRAKKKLYPEREERKVSNPDLKTYRDDFRWWNSRADDGSEVVEPGSGGASVILETRPPNGKPCIAALSQQTVNVTRLNITARSFYLAGNVSAAEDKGAGVRVRTKGLVIEYVFSSREAEEVSEGYGQNYYTRLIPVEKGEKLEFGIPVKKLVEEYGRTSFDPGKGRVTLYARDRGCSGERVRARFYSVRP